MVLPGMEPLTEPARRHDLARNWMRLAFTLAAGAIGGWLLDLLELPLAWMLGAMLATTPLAMAGMPLQRPVRLRVVMLAVLGVMLGSAFSPDVVDRARTWLGTLSAMTVFVGVVTVIGFAGLRRLMRWDRPTAFFSAVPGGFTGMVITGGEMGGDDRTIALVHSVRIMTTVLVIPLVIRLAEDVSPGTTAAFRANVGDLSARDWVALTAAGSGGALGARLLRLPASPLVGPMLVSAAIHLAGLTASRPPVELVNIAQVVIGCAIGCRFLGVSVRRVPETLLAGALTALYMLAMAALAAFVLEPFAPAGFSALWLAFAPGGLPEMALISIALGVDPAFVSSHHLYRVILLTVAAPFAYHLARRHAERRATRP